MLFHTRQNSLLFLFHPSTASPVWECSSQYSSTLHHFCLPFPHLLTGRAPLGSQEPCRKDLRPVRAPGSCQGLWRVRSRAGTWLWSCPAALGQADASKEKHLERSIVGCITPISHFRDFFHQGTVNLHSASFLLA